MNMDLQAWIAKAREVKEKCAATGDQMSVVVICEKQGVLQCMALCPGRDAGLNAAAWLRVSMQIDTFAMMFDSYLFKAVSPTPEQTKALEAIKQGDLGKRFAAGDPNVLECITGMRITRGGEVMMYCFPYKVIPYKTKGGKVQWLPEFDSEPVSTVGGFIPGAMREILGRMPIAIEKRKEILEIADKCGVLDPARREWHMGNVAMRQLSALGGCHVVDFREPPPERD